MVGVGLGLGFGVGLGLELGSSSELDLRLDRAWAPTSDLGSEALLSPKFHFIFLEFPCQKLSKEES